MGSWERQARSILRVAFYVLVTCDGFADCSKLERWRFSRGETALPESRIEHSILSHSYFLIVVKTGKQALFMTQPIQRAAGSVTLSPSAAGDVEAVYAKIAKRIMPFLALLFVMAWLDRYNLGFAKLQMVKDLGFTEAVYGFGAGIVYFGYMLFEVPSNLLLEKIGARKTFARIAILWGITSIATMS